jgi:RIO-like serine/threonine protein kinase
MAQGKQLCKENMTPEISAQIWNAYSAIHDLGVVHSDIAPRNILVDSEAGRVWIIDFESSYLKDEMREDDLWDEMTTVFRMIKKVESGEECH